MKAYEQLANVYDHLMKDMPYEKWVHFAMQVWSQHSLPQTVVELGCGTGNISIPLAENGLKVTGIDISSSMLTIANEKARQQSLTGTLQWVQQDMVHWQVEEQVDSVISFCDSMNYVLHDHDVQQMIQHSATALRDGGTFIFDLHHPQQLKSYFDHQPYYVDEDDVAYIWTCDWDDESQQIDHFLTLFIKEQHQPSEHLFRRFEEHHAQRSYDPQWIKEQLLTAGFRKVHIYGDFEFEPYHEKTQRLFFVAVK
ncbi:class I SAM-dependent DNA methyltransferase [Longirhabdus pacifica]|uniref:class I SAM-dependent DNA methyltransferase n=1 Tax=Longirhabdus pacifica TaxID=2305227 RepID=UPI0010089B76|nr:class I SAM-dependent methyltransferase [Longirhabdus pacifica]